MLAAGELTLASKLAEQARPRCLAFTEILLSPDTGCFLVETGL
jgi:hypothetical protein